MSKVTTHTDHFLTKSKRLHYELIDQIVNAQGVQLPLTEETAKCNQINVNTIKDVYSSLTKQNHMKLNINRVAVLSKASLQNKLTLTVMPNKSHCPVPISQFSLIFC